MSIVLRRRLVIVNPALTRRPVKRAILKQPAPRKRARGHRRGLGDWVESWAKPVAARLDRLTAQWGRHRIKLAGCSACSLRKRFLSQVVPDMRDWRHWLRAPIRLRFAWRTTYGLRRR
jgi:hypothetical protein